jgi:hypothetical protein
MSRRLSCITGYPQDNRFAESSVGAFIAVSVAAFDLLKVFWVARPVCRVIPTALCRLERGMLYLPLFQSRETFADTTTTCSLKYNNGSAAEDRRCVQDAIVGVRMKME